MALSDWVKWAFKDEELKLEMIEDVDSVTGLAEEELMIGQVRYRYWTHCVVGRKRG